MKNTMWKKGQQDRRYFIGGSDARVIMGDDQADLVRLRREKRGELQPQDSRAKPDRPARRGDRRPEPALVRAQYRSARHRYPEACSPSDRTWMAATLDGGVQ